MTEPEAPSLAGVAERLLRLQDAGWCLPEGIAVQVRAAYDELIAVERARQRVMLDAVRADLDGLDISGVPGGQTYRAMALRLAAVIDKRGDDDGPSTTAKLADQLTKVMNALTRKGGGESGDGFEQWQDDASTPVRG